MADDFLSAAAGLASGIKEGLMPFLQMRAQTQAQDYLARREDASKLNMEQQKLQMQSENQKSLVPYLLNKQLEVENASHFVPGKYLAPAVQQALGIKDLEAPVDVRTIPSSLSFEKPKGPGNIDRAKMTLREIKDNGGTIPPRWDKEENLDKTQNQMVQEETATLRANSQYQNRKANHPLLNWMGLIDQPEGAGPEALSLPTASPQTVSPQTSSPAGLPTLGSTFNGHKVMSIKRVG